MVDRITGVLELPFDADGAITKFRFVKLNSDTGVVQCSAAGERALGVFQVDVSSEESDKGKGGAVQVLGVALVEAGANVTRNALVTTDNQGRAIAAASAGHNVLGVAMKGASAGDWVGVLLTPGGAVVPA